MGDSGSGFFGFALAVFAIWTGGEEGIGLWAWLVLMGIFLVDATWTLVRQVFYGQRFYQAHRIHAYHYAARWFGAHRPVTVGGGLITSYLKKKITSVARREAMKKRNIYVICEHFEEPHNIARGREIILR